MNNKTAKNELVLVLKDAQKDLSQLLNALQLAQYVILVVQNRQDYINLIKSTQPDFIVLDFLMSDVNSWQICRQLKNNPDLNNIPLLLINSSEKTAIAISELGWQNVHCIAQSSEPEKIVHFIKTRLQAKAANLVTKINDAGDRDLVVANHQLQATNRDLLNSNRDLEHFASMVSHDLQAPLRSLTMFSELLTSEYQDDLDPKAQEYLERIANSGSRMQTLIEDLLAYSRAGKGEQTWVMVDLNQALQQVKDNLHSAIAQSQAKIAVGDLPKILVNPLEINQLLQNLLENAIKFGGKAPDIKVTAVQKEGEWLISVTDNGIGIADEFQSEIFQAFKRLHSTDVYPGTGIGLAICQKIVERYGGEIGVKSTLGKGSTFYFTLPLHTRPQPLTFSSFKL